MYQSSPSSWRGRGGYAPRRGRGGAPLRPVRREVQPDLGKHPLGKLLQTIKPSDLLSVNLPLGDPAITNCNDIASYNWLNSATPTIVVPGRPPLWTPLPTSQQLKEDSGEYYRDPNAARAPQFPTEPAVRAIMTSNPDFETSEVDVFACGSTLGNLLRFVRSIDKAFRFHVQLVGNTVFFIRKENDPKELIQGVHGYGHTFPEAYAPWERDVKDSETHQRVVQYTLGALKCLVRFECDGFLKDKTDQATAPSQKPGGGSSLTDALDAMMSTASYTPSTTTPLQVKTGGSKVPRASVFDLKTRSGKWKKEFDLEDILPVLWLKQIPNFILAYHNGSGRFERKDISIRDLTDEFKQWEARNQSAITMLCTLLKKIIEIARAEDSGKLDVYSPRAGMLEVRKQHGEGVEVLPDALLAQWANEGVECHDEEEEEDDDDYGGHSPGGFYGGYGYRGQYDSDDDGDMDFTACSVEECGYCGKCTY
ncbi:hypothetical protein BS50DRAFT_600499 [Corynespora cassiicola Philippines]|uniref:Geranylgeranyl pyrophosphate synthetase n=1 Tax=Corynespora cassiicola Philippines TaxID=1448308 RepID=A0A2T2NN94_CORCC|nr:hypothetical protein BS50DRAFT_600499 [Corynespora cassiicola Philippines]